MSDEDKSVQQSLTIHAPSRDVLDSVMGILLEAVRDFQDDTAPSSVISGMSGVTETPVPLDVVPAPRVPVYPADIAALIGKTFVHPSTNCGYTVSGCLMHGAAGVPGPLMRLTRDEFVPLETLRARWVRDTEMEELTRPALLGTPAAVAAVGTPLVPQPRGLVVDQWLDVRENEYGTEFTFHEGDERVVHGPIAPPAPGLVPDYDLCAEQWVWARRTRPTAADAWAAHPLNPGKHKQGGDTPREGG